MTAETDLLPSSVAAFTEALKGERGSLDAWLEVNDEREASAHVEAYARACVSSATEALRAEVDNLAEGWAAQSCRANREEARAERLAEALRRLEEACDDSDGAQYGTLGTSFVRGICKDALLREQEDGRE